MVELLLRRHWRSGCQHATLTGRTQHSGQHLNHQQDWVEPIPAHVDLQAGIAQPARRWIRTERVAGDTDIGPHSGGEALPSQSARRAPCGSVHFELALPIPAACQIY